MIRGLRTLPARLERITRTTQTVIDFLLSHPRVEEVIFPLHPSFPQYELAQRQMNGGCGLLTFTIKTQSCETIEKFCNSLKHILMAVSWGGHESLIIPKCAGLQRADFNAEWALHRSLRLYVGLEEPEYIIADLEQAFDVIKDLS